MIRPIYPDHPENSKKRLFGNMEAIFDVGYLASASVVGILLLAGAKGDSARTLSGVMALVLAGGDAFHLVPRIAVILRGADASPWATALGRGKQITSITMTVFYLLLWRIGLLLYAPEDVFALSTAAATRIVYALAAVRIILCLFPQNRWTDPDPPGSWNLWRNIPFFLLGLAVSGLFFVFRSLVPGFGFMWFAILLSFAFYLPVVVWADRHPKVGMLMLPKTCMYLWMLAMCLSL